VMNIIRDVVKKKEITAIMALHDLNLASYYSDRIIMMNRGKIIAAGDPQSVITEENIAKVYRVEAAVRSLSDRPVIMPLRQIRGARA
ncbi:MAG: ABC transporter ATP-binding protein, partial [Methanothrix soehngenii]